jgi:hypothetical protein
MLAHVETVHPTRAAIGYGSIVRLDSDTAWANRGRPKSDQFDLVCERVSVGALVRMVEG